nr:unnamed protein product [Callosobruchus analis]
MRAEALDAVNGIWIDAKPNVEKFLADLRNLTVIEDDFEEFKIFLNESYYANEFYIRTITNIVVTMFDELALKSHLQSLPKIVQEIWSVMGESGQKIRKSILWVVDKIKLYYKNTTQFIHELINGDPIEHITKVLKKVVERYDEFIKNVHVAALQYVESLWTQTYTMAMEHWHRTLAALEPAFLKFIHYVESMLWHTGRELLDFLYQRKNEIIESPYFVQFTKLSHDVDRFYKDITGNNTIANIYKYTHVAWNFLKEKYLNSVPFGKEVIDIINEVWTELKKLADIPSINFLVVQWNEAADQFKYYYDYFDMENRLQRLVKIIYLKLSDLSVTALEDENR